METTIQRIIINKTNVEMLIADHPNPTEATVSVSFLVPLSVPETAQIGEVELTALRQLRDVIAAEMTRLSDGEFRHLSLPIS